MSKFKSYSIGIENGFSFDPLLFLPKEDHLCFQYEQYVHLLDLSIIEDSYSDLGRPALPPKLLMLIILYGYAVGIRSGRKLQEACSNDLIFIYLSKGLRPRKSAINDFRKAHFLHFEAMFLQVVKMCQDYQCGDNSIAIVDGSKMLANSSKKRTKNEAQLEMCYKHLKEDVALLNQELSAQSPIVTDEIKKKLAKKVNDLDVVSRAIDHLTNNETLSKVNLTDADAPIMKGKKGDFDTYYNVQVSCNESQIINYYNVVTAGNDKAQLIPALQGTAENIGTKVKIALADADYGNFDSFEYMDTNDIEGFVPYTDMNSTYKDQPYRINHFKYNESRDIYTCPAQQVLEYTATKLKKSTGTHYRHYKTKACKKCRFKNDCCRKSQTMRTIEREVREPLREQMKARLNDTSGKAMYNRRMHPVEAIFGQLKFNLQYTHFLLRGLSKVNAEFALMCIAHNLRKLAKHTKKSCLSMKHWLSSRRAVMTRITLNKEITKNPQFRQTVHI